MLVVLVFSFSLVGASVGLVSSLVVASKLEVPTLALGALPHLFANQ